MCTSNTSKRHSTGQNNKDKPAKIVKGIAANMLKHAFLIFRSYLDMVINAIFSFFWDGTRQKIPDLDPRHGMLKESAVTLAAKIRNKQLKSADLVGACIERINAVNPILNAVTDERFEEALKDARAVDRMIENGLSDEYFKNKPFLGVPFTAKESHAIGGMLHTLGVSSRRHTRAPTDAECVALLRAAGAIPVAVTNVPEINKWQETRNMVFGQTCNPHHAGRTTGGSSGGEAALSAALASPISLCSDIGGSTRMPAFYCGLYGLNPTAGYTSLKGSALRSGLDPTMASIGFVSRHVEDLLPLTRIVLADKAKEIDLDSTVDIKDVKFYYTETAQDLRLSPICSDLRNAMTDVIKKLQASGASQPTPYTHRGFEHMYSLWRHAMTKENGRFASMLTNNQGEACALTEGAKKLVGMSEYTLAAIMKLCDDQLFPKVDAKWAEQLIEELKQDLLNLLGTNGVLLFPSAPEPAPYHYSLLLKPYNFAYWGIFNVLHFPALQVPLGAAPSGLPLGVQVVSAPRREALCVSVGRRLHSLYGGCPPPCHC